LKKKELTLVIVNSEKIIFETKAQGIMGLLNAIEDLGTKMRDSSIADKIVGRAAALLCAYSKVSAVYAVTMDENGPQMLRTNAIVYQFEKIVPYILNLKQDSICPFEKLLINISDPKEAFKKLRACKK
jgi:hypothetical protein